MKKIIISLVIVFALLVIPTTLTQETYSLTCKDSATYQQTFKAENLEAEPKQTDKNSYRWTMSKVLTGTYNLDESEYCVINKHRIPRDIPPWR